MTRQKSVWAVVAVLVVGAGAALYYRYGVEEAAPTVMTTPVTRGDVLETVDATGTLQAVTTVQVGTQVSGTIKALHVDFNDRVTRGQIVAELDPSLFEAQVEQARASLTRLQAEAVRADVQLEDAAQKLGRARQLAERQLISKNDLETAEVAARQADAGVKAAQAQITQARASLNHAQVNLGHTIIRAPIDGIIISRNVDVGQTVAASMQAPTLFVIAQDLSEMQVNASIAESDIGEIAPGQPVTFRVDAYPAATFTGTVSQVRLQPVVEQNVVSYVTLIDVPNPDMRLKPGMTANVTIEIARAEDVLRVPNSALRVRPAPDVIAALGGVADAPPSEPTIGGGEDDGPSGTVSNAAAPARNRADVWVWSGNRLTRVPVDVSISDGSRTAVFSPHLEEGAAVVTRIEADAATVPQASSGSASPLLPTFRGRGGGNRDSGGAAPRQR